MARGFNLTAELNLRGPNNIRPIVANIRRQLSDINVDVGVRVNPNTNRDIASIQQSLTRLNATLQQTQTAATAASNSLANLSRNAAAFNNVANNLPRTLNNATAAANNATNTMRQMNRNTQQAADGFEAFGRQSALAIRRFAAFATVTGLIYKFTNAVGTATSEFIDFNKELVRVAQVTDSSLSQLAPLVKTISALSTGLGVTSRELITVSSTLAQAGLSARDTEKALKALALSSLAPSFDSLNETVEGSIALMRQFGIGAGDLESALGSVNAVAAKFAVEASDLITAIQRTGGVFAAASKGVSEGKDALNEFLAVFTSVRQTTRESAETIATGLRTIFTRIQRADTIDALKEYGVVLTDLTGKFVGPYEAVRRLSEGLSKLDPRDLRFSSIVEELGGFRQIGKVIPLIQQFAVAQQALKVAQQGQASLANDAATAQLSIANRLTKVREEFNALIRSLGESSTFQTFVKLSLDLASALIKLADSAKTVLPALTAIAAFRGAAAITRFGAGFAGGLRRQNAGGPVRGFASGGYVPGTGNSDTVPAMLTPGEFVIRKKAVSAIGVNKLHSINRRSGGGRIQKFSAGGIAKAPMIDDILQTTGAILPRPSSIEQLIKAGGGAVDVDRTVKRTTGDKAYGSAPSPGAKQNVINKYFSNDANRLNDIKSAPLTSFGKALQEAVRSGQLNPRKLSIISKSRRTRGVPEYLSQLFGIPVQNMIFTQGGDKQPAIDAIRSKGPRVDRVKQFSRGGSVQRFANGGLAVLRAKDEMYGGLFAKPPVGKDSDPGKIVSFSGSKLPRYQGSDILAVTGRPAQYFMSSSTDDNFESAASQALKGAAERIAASYNISPNNSADLEQKLTQKIGVKDIAGKMFEGLLAYTSNYFGDGSDSSQGGWDFPKSMSEAQKEGLDKLFGPLARNKDYDAKLSLNDKNLKSLMEKAINSNYVDIDPFRSREEPQGVDDNRLSTVAQKKARIDSLKNIMAEAELKLKDSPEDQDKVIRLLRGRINKIGSNLNKPKKRAASGGNISGEDTVPALLTPGEFVINKKAASRIGASRLHQLNRADRVQGYNKGGAVGRVQRFASGGFPTLLSPALSGLSAKETAKLSSAIMNNVDAFNQLEQQVGTLPVDQMLKAMRIFASKLEGGATDIDRAATEAATLAQSGGGGSRQSRKSRVANAGVVIGPANPTTGINESRPVTNPATPRGFADSQSRLDQISQNVGVYQRGQDVVNRRDTQLGSSSVNMSNAGQQFAAQLSATRTPMQQLAQNLVQLGKAVSSPQAAISSLGQAAKSAAVGLGRSTGGAISRVGGGALNAVGLGRFSSTPGSRSAGGGLGAAFGRMGGAGAMIATMGGGVAIDSLSKSMGGEKTETGRQIASVGSQALNYGAMGASIGSMFGPVGTVLGGVAGAAAGVILGFQDAEKAGKEYAQAQAQAASELASEKSGKSLDTYLGSQTAANRTAFLSDMGSATQAEAKVGAGITGEKASSFGKMLGYKDEDAREVGKRKAKTQQAGADQAEKFLAAEMMRSGKTFSELSRSMNPAEFKMLAGNIAEADETYATIQTMRANEIEKLRSSGRGEEADALQDYANKELAGLANKIAERKLAEEQAAVMAKKEADAKKELVLVTMRAVLSLEKTFGAMDQALNKVSFSLEEAATKREEMLSGRASLSSGNIDKDINILQNPNAYSAADKAGAAARSTAIMGAKTGGFVNRVANFSATARDAALQTANSIQSKGAKGGDVIAQNTEIGAGVSNTLINQIKSTFGSDSAMAQTLINGVKASVEKMVKEAGDSAINPEDLVEAAAGPLMKASEKAGELQIKALQVAQKGLVELGKTAEAVANLQQKQVNRTNNLKEMQRNSSLAFSEALGNTISPQDRIKNRMQAAADRVGMVSGASVSAASLSQQKAKAVQEQQQLQGKIAAQEQAALGGDPAAIRQLGDFQKRLAEVNNTIANTDQELENLPQTLESNLNDLLSEIQKRVGEIEAKKEAGANFAERLVTSTPQELVELNATYKLLTNTLTGHIVTVDRSQAAQKAFSDALATGKTRQEAFADAQSAFANENKKAFSLFNDLMQMSGVKGNQFDRMRADLLVNTARAQGMGLENNPMFKEIIKELRRSPEERAKNDPGVKAMLAQAAVIREEQKKAVQEQNAADRILQNDLLQKTGDAIIKAIQDTKLQIQVAVQNVANGAGGAPPFPPVPAGGRATGGLIYASKGRLINFEPKGTDTVPAMLTPGEFVVNAKATRENLPLLKRINSGSAEGYSKGGLLYARAGANVQQPQFPVTGDNKTDQLVRNNINLTQRANKSIDFGNKKSTDSFKQLHGMESTIYHIWNETDGVIDTLYRFTKEQTKTLGGLIVGSAKALEDQIVDIAFGQVNRLGGIGKGAIGRLEERFDVDTLGRTAQWGFARGGMVYASNGTLVPYEPKGTDTVPAMLTPGEFVVNRSATQKNLPLLQSINNGETNYLAGGGMAVNEISLLRDISNNLRTRAGNINDRKKRNKFILESQTQPAGVRVIEELGAQMDDLGGDRDKYFGITAFNAGRQDKKMIEQKILGKIGQGTAIEQTNNAGESYRTSMLRRSYLQAVNNNVSIAQKILNKDAKGISKYYERNFEKYKGRAVGAEQRSPELFGKGFVERVNKLFDIQESSSDSEDDYIKRAWREIESKKPKLAWDRIKQMMPAARAWSPFDADLPDKDSYLYRGGIVYAANGKKIDRAASIIANEPKALNSYLKLQGKKLGISPTIESVVSYLYKNNINELNRVAKKYPDIQKRLNEIRSSKSQMSPFQTGGMVYASNGKKIDRASSIIANEPKALNSYLKLQGKRLGVPANIDSVVSFLYKNNIKELERAAKQYPDIKKQLDEIRSPKSQASPFALNRGGVVYASNGRLINFQPKGTDTVPAMLTPGEFVVNRKATQQNLPLLQSLNSGHYSSGGQVAYLSAGTPGTAELTNNIKYFTEILKNGADTLSKAFQEAVSQINKANDGMSISPLQRTNGVSNSTNATNPVATIDLLGAKLDRFIEQLQASIPPVIKVEGEHQVNVVINGASVLQNVLSGPIGNIVQQAIQSAFDAKSRKNEGN